MFHALDSRNFRIFFGGQLVSVTGTWMQRVAQDWLILQLGGGALGLSIGLSLQSVPVLLFGVWGGLVVDRTRDRRRLMVITQSAFGGLAGLLGILAVTGHATLLIVYVAALVLGIVTIFDSPARQTFVVTMVGPERLANATALNASINNASRLVGPAIAGVVIALTNAGVAFLLNAASFLAIVLALLLIDGSALDTSPAVVRGRGQVIDGFRYTFHERLIRTSVVATVVVSLLSQNFRVTLPVLASEVFGGGAGSYGALMSALGVGALIGALVCAYLASPSLRMVAIAAALFGVLLMVVTFAPTFLIALALMVGVGAGNTSFNTTSNAWVILASEPQLRGRVVSLRSLLSNGLTPVGSLAVGAICEVWGARAGLAVGGVAALAVAAYVARTRPIPAGPRPVTNP